MSDNHNPDSVLAPNARRFRFLGRCVMGLFGLLLLNALHLAFIGRVHEAFPARLDADRIPEADEPVLYVYRVGDITYHDWRRGIEWGGETFHVVCSPIVPWIHVSSLRPALTRPSHLWGDPDFLLRIGLYGVGTGLGIALVLMADRLARGLPRNWQFLPGLDPPSRR